METITARASQLFLPSQTKLSRGMELSRFPPTPFLRKPIKQVCLMASSYPNFQNQESNRTFKKLLPSPWIQHFHSVSVDVSEMDAIRKEMGILKPKVKNTLMTSSTKKRILMIYLLVSLGIAYHFEEEIEETLKAGFEKIQDMMAGEEDLYTVSTIFWVFRKYRHYISSDVFEKFKGRSGNFGDGDAKGILSLYEAAQFRTTKDYILEEALGFTSSRLVSLAAARTCPPHLSKRIRNALSLSQNWNMDMLFAVDYISFYGQEKDHDEMLLKFAKLSFKLLQLHYLQEIKVAIKWYKEVDLASNLPPYFRDRLIENHFLAQTMLFEPQLSRARIILTYCFTLLGLQDDTFDRYASLPEAECLANSLNRWAPDHAMDKQPYYLKFVFKLLFDTFEEFEKELAPQGQSYLAEAAIEEVKTLVKANIQIEKWAKAAHVPSFGEYMEVAGVSFGVIGSLASNLMAMGKMVRKDDYERLQSKPKLIQALKFKGRLMNDLNGYKEDMSRGYAANAVICYMKQYGVTEEKAVRELNKMVADAEKTINEELLTAVGISRCVLEAAMGVAIMIHVAYNGCEGYTHPEGTMKEFVTSIYVDQIRL